MVRLALHHWAHSGTAEETMKSTCSLFVVSGFGLGLIPKAPGTWGSLIPLIVVLACGHFGVSSSVIVGTLVALVFLFSILTIERAKWYTKYFGRNDPPQVVSDEVVGQSIALLCMAWFPLPTEDPESWIGLAVLSFVLFRIFDIWKPGLIDSAQNFNGGWGVLMDDVFAGIVAGGLVLAASTFVM